MSFNRRIRSCQSLNSYSVASLCLNFQVMNLSELLTAQIQIHFLMYWKGGRKIRKDVLLFLALLSPLIHISLFFCILCTDMYVCLNTSGNCTLFQIKLHKSVYLTCFHFIIFLMLWSIQIPVSFLLYMEKVLIQIRKQVPTLMMSHTLKWKTNQKKKSYKQSITKYSIFVFFFFMCVYFIVTLETRMPWTIAKSC